MASFLPETSRVQRQRSGISYSKHWKKHAVSQKICIKEKLSCKKEQEITALSDEQNETIHHQQACPAGNAEGRPFGEHTGQEAEATQIHKKHLQRELRR